MISRISRGKARKEIDFAIEFLVADSIKCGVKPRASMPP